MNKRHVTVAVVYGWREITHIFIRPPFQSLGNFGPLKCREIYALDKLQKQADIVEQLVKISQDGPEVDLLPGEGWNSRSKLYQQNLRLLSFDDVNYVCVYFFPIITIFLLFHAACTISWLHLKNLFYLSVRISAQVIKVWLYSHCKDGYFRWRKTLAKMSLRTFIWGYISQYYSYVLNKIIWIFNWFCMGDIFAKEAISWKTQ